MTSGDANPYRLLEQNFDKRTVLEPVMIYDTTQEKSGITNRLSEKSVGDDPLSFTYDRDHMLLNSGKYTSTAAESSFSRERAIGSFDSERNGSKFNKQAKPTMESIEEDEEELRLTTNPNRQTTKLGVIIEETEPGPSPLLEKIRNSQSLDSNDYHLEGRKLSAMSDDVDSRKASDCGGIEEFGSLPLRLEDTVQSFEAKEHL